MHTLEALFPANNFTLLAAILLLPLLGALVNGIFGKRLGKEGVTLMALVAVGAPFVLAVLSFVMLSAAQHGEHAARFTWFGWRWMTLSAAAVSGAPTAGEMPLPIDLSFSIDALSGTMALVITGVGFLIHLYSTKYMADDPSYYRFFAYLNLFIFSMLVLILGDSLPVLFVGWEGVGLCSYLLIGFWFEGDKNAAAGKKAFIANRIGDFGLLVAMGLLVYYVGKLDWAGIEAGRMNLLSQPQQIWPLGGHVPLTGLMPDSWAAAINRPHYVSRATLVALALFLGCAGKSAQIPLYVWLPDAMAGPTPVSALIHAATMVTAGVYLVCRMSAVFVLSPGAMFVVALIGGLTAVFAATIALVQNDIKKVLAYSTVSQLGYMFLGVGVGAFTAGFFHVLTHAFFKACLFLGAGSIIHAMHARIHDSDASQDMRNMGGLKRYMPSTFWTFVFAWAAIVGFPLTAGFFSKDEILLKAYSSAIASPVAGGQIGGMPVFEWPKWGPSVLYGLGAFGAVLTAFYMTRLVIGIFFGEFKGWQVVKKWKPARASGHGHDAHEAHAPGEPLDGPAPHESPWQMTAPLWILGVLSLFVGLLNAPLFKLESLEHWLEPVFEHASASVTAVTDAGKVMYPLLGVAVVLFAAGSGVAYWMYMMQKGEPARRLAEAWPRLYRLVSDKWRIDELYDETILGAVDSLAEFFVWADKWLVDGVLARLSAFVVSISGTVLRHVQTGRTQAYAAVMVVGVGGLGWFFVTPHAAASVQGDDLAGTYTVTAEPGFGYGYRWDADGDGKWDTEGFDAKEVIELTVEAGKTLPVKLQVKNAFGRIGERVYPVHHPKPDRSAPGMTTIEVQRGADGRPVGVPQRAPGQPANTAAPEQLQQLLRQLGQHGQGAAK